nr:hypothetical protein BaRGS_033791 [Batillaria attramentaria]
MGTYNLAMSLTLVALFVPALVSAKPNIIFVLMDDVGYRDLGHVDPTFYTPTIDRLRSEGIRMSQSYTPPNCGPSRTALFSGAFSFRLGLQVFYSGWDGIDGWVDGWMNEWKDGRMDGWANGLRTSAGSSVPLDHTFLPQKLQKEGYKTHMIGKWHQGFCNWAMYPTNRGFDSFYGFLLSGGDHFKHTAEKKEPPYGYDFRFNERPEFDVAGEYSVHIFSERARTIIREHKEEDPNNDKPFFILLSHQAIHVPNQVPQKYVDDHCQGVSDPERKIKCGMLAAVDEGLKNILDELNTAGFLDNTLIVFTSDNGGGQTSGSSNFPLRGGKGTIWEGGIRVPSFIYSASRDILPNANMDWSGLFHQVDWYGTLWGFATQKGLPRLTETPDGFNMWRKLYNGLSTSFREEFAYINEAKNATYIRKGDWKLMLGENSEAGWYMPPDGVTADPGPRKKDIPYVQLYNIADDPNEKQNKADDLPDVVADLKKALDDNYWSIWQPEKVKDNSMDKNGA